MTEVERVARVEEQVQALRDRMDRTAALATETNTRIAEIDKLLGGLRLAAKVLGVTSIALVPLVGMLLYRSSALETQRNDALAQIDSASKDALSSLELQAHADSARLVAVRSTLFAPTTHYIRTQGIDVPPATTTRIDFNHQLVDIRDAVKTGTDWTYTSDVEGTYAVAVHVAKQSATPYFWSLSIITVDPEGVKTSFGINTDGIDEAVRTLSLERYPYLSVGSQVYVEVAQAAGANQRVDSAEVKIAFIGRSQ